jgi:thiosulfate reductase cytochrome b subunit
MGLLMLLTGLAIYKPAQLYWLCAMLGGYEWARAEHFIITILFVLFFAVHIIQVILAGWNNFRGMVTGFEVVPAEKVPKDDAAATASQSTDLQPNKEI